jgi:hypothetical protein
MKRSPGVPLRWVVLMILGGCAGAPPEATVVRFARSSAVVRRVESASILPADSFAVQIVEVGGDPTTMGTSYGKQLGNNIRQLHTQYINVYLQNEEIRMLALMLATGFDARLRPEHRDEIAALAAASGFTKQETLLAQCFLDISPMVACSTVTLPADAAPDHVARFGRNLDFPGFNVADKNSILLIYHPKDRYQFATVSWPGLIGVLSGMNEHGLCIANMEVTRPCGLVARGMPYTLLYRTVLEHCRTVDEAIDLLKATPRQTPNNLMLMDAAGDRAVVELAPAQVVVRRGQIGAALLSTNHRRGEDTDTAGRCWRYDKLHELSQSHFGSIDVPALESMLAAVAQGDTTLQSMVFEPANRVMYLSAGKGAASKRFSRLDLRGYFTPHK